MSEKAKAVQEVAKTTNSAIEASEKVAGFVAKVVGDTAIQLGGVLADWTHYYRFKNLLTIADKIQTLQRQRRLEGKTNPIPPRIAIPLLEAAALEDDPTLQDVWALLIANSTDPNFAEVLHPSFIGIIQQISADEAVILNNCVTRYGFPVLFHHHLPKEGQGLWTSASSTRTFTEITERWCKFCHELPLKNAANAGVYLDNLQRLKLVELGYDFSNGGAFGQQLIKDSIPARDEYLKMTAFGTQFVSACMKPHEGKAE
jgi:hypothetical protein